MSTSAPENAKISLVYTHPDTQAHSFTPTTATDPLPLSPTFTPSTGDKTRHLSILRSQIVDLQGQVNEFLTKRMKDEPPVVQGKRGKKVEESENEEEQEAEEEDEENEDEEQGKEGYQQLGAGTRKGISTAQVVR